MLLASAKRNASLRKPEEMEEVTEDESGLFKYLSESVDRLMMVEWRECRPAHVLKTCTVQPLSVIVDEIYLPLLTHEVRALVC